jgi:hypothetical protein
MSRETRLNRTIRRAVERRVKETEPKTPLLRRRIVAVVLFLIGVPGVLAALLSLLPRVTVALSDPVDLEEPFSSSVTITNTGFIPLDNPNPCLAIGQVAGRYKQPNLNWIPNYETRFCRSDWTPPPRLAVDDRITFALNDFSHSAEPNGIRYADIAIVIQYEIPLIHLRREKVFPFVTHRQSNGHLYWYSKISGESESAPVLPKPN